MKRKVLCFFSFLVLLFAFLSLVSPKVEEEMVTIAEVREANAANGKSVSIPKSAVEWEGGDGEYHLFIVVEGSGWQEGLRVSEVPPQYYDFGPGHVTLGPGATYRYIYSASKRPNLGGAVRTVELTKGTESYLIWSPEPIENKDSLPKYFDVAAITDNAILFNMKGASLPFFAHTLQNRFSATMGEEIRIYSMTDAQQFAEMLPKVLPILMILICAMILWGVNWCASRKRGSGKAVWIVNTLLIVGLFVSIPWFAGRFDLPASLMPQDNILDFSHYSETFGRITGPLDEMGVTTIRDGLSQAGKTCAKIVGLSLLATVLFAAVELWLSRRYRKKHPPREEAWAD